MMSASIGISRRIAVVAALAVACIGWAASPAQARVFIGIGIPFYGPGFYPSPYYYPPPVYYPPPPPVVYAPPPPYAPPAYTPPPSRYAGGGQECHAEGYVCPMERPVAAGSSCYCPGNGGQRVWGRAN